VDALRTIPLVIFSRVRRTTDAQVLLMQAFALYISFLAAAWLKDGTLLGEQWGFLRLAIPAGMAMLGLILEDAYAKRGRRQPTNLARGPVLGIGFALLLQGTFWIGHSGQAVPLWITVYGCGMSLLLSSAVRILFPPATDRLQGANAHAVGPERTSGASTESPAGIARFVKSIATILLVVLIAYLVWKRQG
jgi:hypothetical protein